MVNCTYTEIDECDFLRTVIAEKKQKSKDILNPICDRVEVTYDQYLNDFPELCLKPTSEFAGEGDDAKAQRQALQKCYSSHTQTFIQFRTTFFTKQPPGIRELCPYCMIGGPETIDHYIGQTEFPEFSILTKNLFPSCWKCNHLKSERWREGGTRKYINFYTDQFLQFPFLVSELVLDPATQVPAIQYNLQQPTEVTDEQFTVIEHHFAALNLLTEYSKKANNALTTEIEITLGLIKMGFPDAVIEPIPRLTYETLTRKFGPNYWEAHLYLLISSNINMIRNL